MPSIQLQVTNDDNSVDEYIGQLAEFLRKDLHKLGADSVETPKAADVPGARGGEEILGVLLVTFGPTFVAQFLGFMKDWILAKRSRTIKVKFKSDSGAETELEVSADTKPQDVERVLAAMKSTLG